MSRPRRRKSADRPSDRYRAARSALADVADDVRYLAIKQQLGEPLTESERARLEDFRSEPVPPKPAGGQS